ncbi:MAG: hypothetical protein GY816_17895 [Cytophagales bacterium]|nr:hypothetical protein [Cytophagales bacterium]
MTYFRKHITERVLFIVLVLFSSGCATFYQINLDFNQKFEYGELEAANKVLESNKKESEKKARFLYYNNKGVVESMLGNYEVSNEWFEKAYIFGEDYTKKAGQVAASFLINPNVLVYPGEDHEHLILLYYKALNYLKLGDRQSALVECRRLNNRLNTLSDKYKSDNKYKQDAFIHNLMGIIYEADRDFNNAFIAYRNAYNVYKDVYVEMFGVSAPEQLKKDLIRSAYLTGFATEVDFYKNEFDMQDYQPTQPESELVFFWHNGLGPVKDEWSFTFATGGYSAGFFTFTDEYGYPYIVPCTQVQANSLADLSVVRVAFPKYNERPPIFHEGHITTEGRDYSLELVENVNLIAIKTLQERMAKEITTGILRFALKKVIENQVRQEDQNLGFLVSVLNASTEKADTRNWQTIPHSIYYTRVPLHEGTNHVELTTTGSLQSKTSNFTFEVQKSEIIFHSYQSLESFVQQ